MSPRRYALVIGCPTFGLQGSANDAALMADLLTDLNFDVVPLMGEAATRASILTAYEALTRRSRTGDAVAVYFSGHGGLVPWDGQGNNPWGPEPLQFLVPHDLSASTDRDFRGLLNVELSRLHAAIADITGNMTVIMDCCHATGMARHGLFVKKALSQEWTRGLASRMQDLQARGLHRHPHDLGHPRIVHVYATGRLYPAYERYSLRGKAHLSLMTEELCAVLRRRGTSALTWRALIGRVREQVWAVNDMQRPGISGPIDRLPFRVEKHQGPRAHTFYYAAGQPALRAGTVHGVVAGDVFDLHDPGAPTDGVPRAEATVTDVFHDHAYVRPSPPDARLPRGLQAVPRSLVGGTYGLVPAPGQTSAGLAALLRAPSLTAVGPDAKTRRVAMAAREGNGYRLWDRDGVPVPPEVQTEAEARSTLARMMRARLLLDLQSEDVAEVPSAYQLDWGEVRDGVFLPRPYAGAVLRTGDGLYVRLRNRVLGEVYVHVFNINSNWEPACLTAAHPSGVPVLQGETRCLGYDARRGRCLWVLGPPSPHVAAAGVPFKERLVVVVTGAPCDLQAYAGPRHRSLGLGSPRDVLVHAAPSHRGAAPGSFTWDVVQIVLTHH